MKKCKTTRELVNIFPLYTKVRQNDQSTGFLLLNSLAEPMEYMTEQLLKAQKNNYLTTCNLDEIDLLYKVVLPTTFNFSEDNSDPFNPQYIPPTVSGLVDNTWHSVSVSELNNVEDFWYNAIPDRISLDEIVSGIETSLISDVAENFPVSGEYSHHLDNGGRLWFETTGGIEYITIANQIVNRGQVIIEGKTRKGTIETENIIFPWDMKQPTQKEWKTIYNISVHNIEDGVTLDVSTADFSSGPYLSFYNTRYSENRNKIDEFWDLGVQDNVPTLDMVGYVSDEWQQLVLGFSNREVKESWELIDENYTNVSGIDLAIQPFTNRGWVVDGNSNLYCYDLTETTISGVNLLKDSLAGAQVQIEVNTPSVVLGQNIDILPWHARPLKEIRKHRVWYQTPSGVKYGLLNNTPVSYSSDFYVTNTGTLSRTIDNHIILTATERGEYLFVIETIFVDGETETYKVIVPVNYKVPLVQFDLSSIISNNIDGIDFSSDQELWIKAQNDIYKINLHFDNMLIDYTNKIIYFRENYDQVGIES